MTIIKKFDPEKFEQTQFSKKRYVVLISILVLTLVIIEIWITHNLAKFSDKFDDIARLEESLRLENQILKNKLAQKSSILNISSQSAASGFSKPTNIEYIR